MCGRYALSTTPAQLTETFQLLRSIDFAPRFNIAPSSQVPVIRQSPEGERVSDLLRWGLIPNWAKDPAIGARLNNARSESVAEKPSFRDAFKRRRCLVPMSGFFEWTTTQGGKQPFFIHAKDGGLLAMGGLWESWRNPEGEIVRSFCVITTGPNAVMATIHDRMPVLLAPQDFQRWLDPSIPGVSLLDLLAPPPADSMEAWPVSRKVSNAANEGPDLINPVEV